MEEKRRRPHGEGNGDEDKGTKDSDERFSPPPPRVGIVCSEAEEGDEDNEDKLEGDKDRVEGRERNVVGVGVVPDLEERDKVVSGRVGERWERVDEDVGQGEGWGGRGGRQQRR